MKTFEKNGVTYIDIGNGRPVQKWVFDFVLEKIEGRLKLVAGLDWFYFRQLMGEDAWLHLMNKKQHHGAGRCFAFIVESGYFAIERMSEKQTGTQHYRVKTN